MAQKLWPWQWAKKAHKRKKVIAELRFQLREKQLSIEAYERGKQSRDEALNAANLRVHDLECEVKWLRELREVGAMAIVVSKENLEQFLSALRQLQKGGE